MNDVKLNVSESRGYEGVDLIKTISSREVAEMMEIKEHSKMIRKGGRVMNDVKLNVSESRGYEGVDLIKTISSREVAEMMEIKEHSKMIRKIEQISATLTEAKIGVSVYWLESTYKDVTGRTLKEYQVTKKGCEMLAHKSTGDKGIIFTHKYMERESTYKDVTGRTLKEYQVTKKGCEMLAHKSTGDKGIIFTHKYMERFEQMERIIQLFLPTNTWSVLNKWNALSKNVLRKPIYC